MADAVPTAVPTAVPSQAAVSQSAASKCAASQPAASQPAANPTPAPHPVAVHLPLRQPAASQPPTTQLPLTQLPLTQLPPLDQPLPTELSAQVYLSPRQHEATAAARRASNGAGAATSRNEAVDITSRPPARDVGVAPHRAGTRGSAGDSISNGADEDGEACGWTLCGYSGKTVLSCFIFSFLWLSISATLASSMFVHTAFLSEPMDDYMEMTISTVTNVAGGMAVILAIAAAYYYGAVLHPACGAATMATLCCGLCTPASDGQNAPPAYSRLDEADKRHLPMRRALMELRHLSKLKSLGSFGVFYLAYVSLSTVRLDYWHGHETLVWLEDAHAGAGVEPVTHATTVEDIAAYLDGNLADVIKELKGICSKCEVGVTPQQGDMTYLDLEDFVCSDFDSVVGSAVYPSRDCWAEDRLWAKSPSSLTAPCCGNATLVRASVAMMTEAIAYGLTELPLARLLSGGTDHSYSSTEFFVRHFEQEENFMLQLIVSRDQRMAGIEYHVAALKDDAPDRVHIIPAYWSFNYANVQLQHLLLGIMCVAGVLTLAHDRRRMVEHFCGPVRIQRSLWDEILDWRRQWGPYVVLVEIQSIVLPLVVEVLMPFLQLPTWTFWVVYTEMVLSVRLLHEGMLAPALRRLVAVLDEATPNMIALVVVLVPLSALTSLMYSQLFGLFDDGFSDPVVSLSRVVNMLTAPPPSTNTEGEELESQERGAELLFYWSTIIIRLCFGSFIVAILVGAWNKVINTEAQAEIRAARDASLPPGYLEPAAQRTGCTRALQFLDFFCTARLYGTYEPRLIEALETQIHLTEHADSSGAASGTQLMVNAAQLGELVGKAPAAQLLSAHGVLSVDGQLAAFDA